MDDEERKARLDSPNQVTMTVHIGDNCMTVMVLRSGQFALPQVNGESFATEPRKTPACRKMPSALDVRKAIVEKVRALEREQRDAMEQAYLATSTLEAFDEANADELAVEVLGRDAAEEAEANGSYESTPSSLDGVFNKSYDDF